MIETEEQSVLSEHIMLTNWRISDLQKHISLLTFRLQTISDGACNKHDQLELARANSRLAELFTQKDNLIIISNPGSYSSADHCMETIEGEAQ